MPDSKLKHIGYVLGQIWKGVKEDITYDKRFKGIGKWNDVVKKKKEKQTPKPSTPWRTFGDKQYQDMLDAIAARKRAERQ